MKTLSTSDIYQVRASHELDSSDTRIILQLYQPIIGLEATSLYLTLYSELNLLTLTKKPALISRLCKITGFSLSSLSQAFSKLEAIGLVSTYLKHHENRYLFDLKMPLSADGFIHHQILNSILKSRLNHEYEKTILSFQSYNVDSSQYEDVSSSFSDVYDLMLNQEDILVEKEYQDKKYNIIEEEYDLALFYQGLEGMQLSKKMFTKEDISLIQQLGILYKINVVDMLDIVKSHMVNDKLNRNDFIKECRNHYDLKMPESYEEIFHVQSPLLHQSTGKESLDYHINYLENTSPYDLLKDKLGGKEPLKRDLQVVESVLTELDLEPGVMNALIELTLEVCHQSLPRNFIEALASQWKRKNIETVKDAINEGKAYLKNMREYRTDNHFVEEIKPEDKKEVKPVSDELMEKLKKLYE